MDMQELARELNKLAPGQKKKLLGHMFAVCGAKARNQKLSARERKRIASKAGKASGRARRKKAREKKE